MSDELIFFTHPMSRGRTVRWMLEEVGQPYRTEVLEYGTTMKAPAYLAINPMGKVPALRHGATVVTETAAICAYLADVFPAASLAPSPTDPLRGPYYRWLFFAAGPLEAAWTNQAMGFVTPPDRERMVGLRQLCRRARCAGSGGRARPLSGGEQFQRRGPLCRRSTRLRPAVRHDRGAPGLRGLCRTARRAARRGPRKGDRRRNRSAETIAGRDIAETIGGHARQTGQTDRPDRQAQTDRRDSMKIGFIGLGIMGRPMALNLKQRRPRRSSCRNAPA